MRKERRFEDCFAEPDLEFAFLPVQIDAALEWVNTLRANDSTWAEAREEIEAFLKTRQADKSTSSARSNARRP
jgi:hypothetical protein